MIFLFTLHLFLFSCKEEQRACSCFSCYGCCSCGCATEVYACGYCSCHCCHTAQSYHRCRFVVELYPLYLQIPGRLRLRVVASLFALSCFYRYSFRCVGRIHTQFQRTAICRYFVCIEGLFQLIVYVLNFIQSHVIICCNFWLSTCIFHRLRC